MRGGRADYELALMENFRARLRVSYGGPAREEREGSWTRQDEFIVLRLHPVVSDPSVLENGGPSPDDLAQMCRARVALPTPEGLLLYFEVHRDCDDVGDLHEIVRLTIGPPVKLKRVTPAGVVRPR